MFKKAKDINPLPAGMADAFGAALSQQGFKSPVVEEPAVEVAPAVEADAELSESAGKRKADQADGDVAVPKAGDVTPEIGEIKTKAKRKLDKDVSDKPTALKASYSEAKTVKEDCEDCECEPCECDSDEVEEGTLPPALQKAIDKKNAKKDGKKVEDEDEDEELSEGTITVKSFTGKAPAGIKMKKMGSSSFGGDDVEMSGPDAKIIAYAKKSLGCDAKCNTIADVQKQVSEMYESKCANHEEVKEGLDDVDQKAIKKKFTDRKDKDLDNDGDEDESDKYLHRRRKAIAKALED